MAAQLQQLDTNLTLSSKKPCKAPAQKVTIEISRITRPNFVE
jgi:hypothetical protein